MKRGPRALVGYRYYQHLGLASPWPRIDNNIILVVGFIINYNIISVKMQFNIKQIANLYK